MTGHAYRTSARIAEAMGPFAGYAPNRDAMLRVMRKHRAAADEIDAELVPEGLLSAAKQSWDEAIALGEQHGYRNAQASVLAPTGTIGLMMDCDTTGIEPDLALVKTKKLVGGGHHADREPDRARGRSAGSATTHDAGRGHRGVHRRAQLGGRTRRTSRRSTTRCSTARWASEPIHYMGHVRMMAAAQPFISGAISKTVNMPEHVDGRGGRAAVRGGVEARPEGRGDLPRQLQGGPAAVGATRRRPRRPRRPPSSASRSRRAPAASRPRQDDLVPGGRRRGLHHGGRVPGRRHRRDLPEGRRSRAPRCRASWTPSPSRSRSACSTACRWRPTSRSSST